MSLNGIWQSSETGNDELIMSLVPLSGIPILISILSIIAIFLFRKRKIQLKLAGAIVLLTTIFIGLMVYFIFRFKGEFQAELVLVYRMFIPVLILIFGILAYLGIRRDENLVKSLDRLR